MGKLYEIRVKLSEFQRLEIHNYDKKWDNNPIKIRLSKSSLWGDDPFYVPYETKLKLEYKRIVKKGLDIPFIPICNIRINKENGDVYSKY